MNKQLRTKVSAIALDTRYWVQAKADDTNYNPDDLLGWCAIASAELHKRFEREGISSEIHVWEGDDGFCHCFNVVDDHVVDITASQFNDFELQLVVIIHTKEAEGHFMYQSSKVFAHSKALRKYQKKQDWPSKQLAYA